MNCSEPDPLKIAFLKVAGKLEQLALLEFLEPLRRRWLRLSASPREFTCRISGYTEVISQNPFLFLLVADLVVLLEQILAKVPAEVAPHGMDVVGVVLRVV